MWFSKELKLGLQIVSNYLFIFSYIHLDLFAPKLFLIESKA